LTALQAAESSIALVVGGTVRANSAAQAGPRVAETIAGLIQVRAFSVLVGAGCSYQLGLPRIRSMSAQDIRSLLDRTESQADESSLQLLDGLVGDEQVDLEALLAQIQICLAYCERMGLRELAVKSTAFSTDAFLKLRRILNRALAVDCDWRRHESDWGDELRRDPLKTHREFLRKLVTARRPDLPRIRVFTTNYDLVLESALDELRLPYSDGFVGTVTRWLQLESFDRDLYQQQPGRRLQRVPDMLYLYKLHGSVNWSSEPSGELSSAEIRQLPMVGDQAVIFPTPQKDWDVMGYPYSDLLRAFSAQLMEPECALLAVGYGFGDDHINRVIGRAIKTNPTMQLMLVAPSGVLKIEPEKDFGEAGFEETRLAALARISSPRITVLTGTGATFGGFVRQYLPDPERDATEAEREQGLAAAVDAALELTRPNTPQASGEEAQPA
jgi:hypothetical protein